MIYNIFQRISSNDYSFSKMYVKKHMSVSVQVFDLSNFVDNILDYQVYYGYEELEFDFGEKALETAFIFKEGSRCAIFNPNSGR